MRTISPPKLPLRQLILPIYFPSALMATGEGIVLLLIPLFAVELGGAVAGAGTMFALKGIGSVLSDMPTGLAIARFGEKRLMLFGLFLMFVSMLVSSFSQTLLLLGTGTFGFGVGFGVFMLTRLNFIAETTFLHQRGRGMSILGGIQRIGRFLGPIIGGVCIKFFGFQITFLIAALIAAIVFVFLLFVLPGAKKRTAKHHFPKVLALIPRILAEHKKIFLTAGVAAIALQITRVGRQLLFPLWGGQIGLDAAQIGFILGLSSAIDMSLFFLSGIVMDRFGRKWAAVPCIFILGMSLILLPFSDSFLSFLLIGLLAGFGNGMGSGIIMTMGADLSPSTERSEFLGVWRFVGDLGTVVGPIFIGLLGKLFVLGTASIATGGIGLFGAGIMLFFVRETMIKYELNSNSQNERENPV
ncbi:MAG: MFS transporter [SAR324 cluster bacterium]|nr:MFS transporter [SAR324 cluster bacterium]